MFIIHSTMLLFHLPFLVRCELRGPQNKLWRKTFDEIRDSLWDLFFCHVYCMTKTSFENLYAILWPRLVDEFLPGGGGGRGTTLGVKKLNKIPPVHW
jgi:hypothetical protein